jgi:hypothetical protein
MLSTHSWYCSLKKSVVNHTLVLFIIAALILLSTLLTARSDYASLSSGTLNLSAPLTSGTSMPKDEVPCSLVSNDAGKSIFVAGFTSSASAGGNDVFLVKVTQKLNTFPGMGSYYMDSIAWQKTYGGSQDDVGKCIIQSNDGNFVIAGQTRSYGAGGSDVYLLKVDGDGNMLWNKTYGTPQDDGANSIVQSLEEDYLIAGYIHLPSGSQNAWLMKMDSQGQQLWNQTYAALSINSIMSTNEGGYVLAAENPTAFELIKVDSNGQTQFDKTYSFSGVGESECAIQTGDGGYAIAGYTTNGAGANSSRLIKTDASGIVQWDRTYPGLGAYSLIQTLEGGYALTGDRAFLLITDSSGNVLWNLNYDGLSEDNLHFTRAYDISEPAAYQFLMVETQQSYGMILTGLDAQMTRVTLRNGDTTAPKITVLSPQNTIYTSSNLPLTYYVDKPTVWMAYSVDKGKNITISGNTTITLPDGQHNMTLYAADTNYNNGASNVVYFSNFAVDTIPIDIRVTSIQKDDTFNTKDIPLNFTTQKQVTWTSYSLDGQANVTTPQNTVLSGLTPGPHTITVYGQDAIGLIEGSEVITFSISEQPIPELPTIAIPVIAIAALSIFLVLTKKRTISNIPPHGDNNNNTCRDTASLAETLKIAE